MVGFAGARCTRREDGRNTNIVNVMTETEFQQQVEHTLASIETALDAVDVDVDFERKADTVLELSFEDDSRIIVNGQAAAQEIWIAAKSGGQHFRYDGGAWVNTRDGSDLFRALSAVVSQQCGQGVILRP
jgi:CyaY protein